MDKVTYCPACGAENEDTSNFCSQCGSRLLSHRVPPTQSSHLSADHSVGGYGASSPQSEAQSDWEPQTSGVVNPYAVGPLPPLAQAESQPSLQRQSQAVSCEDCAHFRKVSPVSDQLVYGGGATVSQAITKIKEDETKQRIAEGKQKVELLKVQSTEWGFRPIMSDFCAAKAESDVFGICEIKNREKNCPDFESEKRDYSRTCSSCVHAVFVNLRKNFNVLEGIHDPKIHHGMMEAIQAEEAEEITSIYFRKGESQGEPQFHSWCRFYSRGKYIALPYPNVHSDCPHHELKPDYAPIANFVREQPRESSTQPNDRLELIAIQSQYMAAARAGDTGSLVAFFRRQFERIRSGELPSPLSQQFEDWAFIILLSFRSTPKGGSIATALSGFHPQRLKRLQEDESRLRALVQAVEKNNPFFQLINNSAYTLINQVAQEVDKERLKAICLQTIREGLAFDNGLSVSSKLQWIAEEEVRIANGMYPEYLVDDLRRLVKTLKLAESQAQAAVKKAGKENELKQAIADFAILAIPEIIEYLSRQAAIWSVPCPLPLVPLSEEEKRILGAMFNGDYDLEDAVLFLEARYKQLCDAVNSFQRSSQQENAAMDGFGGLKHLARDVTQATTKPILMGVTFRNFLSRRLRPREHEDWPPCIELGKDLLDKVKAQDVEGYLTNFPEEASLFALKYNFESRMKPQMEEKAAETRGLAERDVENTQHGESIELRLPDNGEFKYALVQEVLVAPNDRVAMGQTLLRIQTDKAFVEIPSPRAGVVESLKVKYTDRLSQGDPILTLRVEGAAGAAGAPAVKFSLMLDGSNPAVEQLLSHAWELEPIIKDIQNAIEQGDQWDLKILEAQLRGYLQRQESLRTILGITQETIDGMSLNEIIDLLRKSGIGG